MSPQDWNDLASVFDQAVDTYRAAGIASSVHAVHERAFRGMADRCRGIAHERNLPRCQFCGEKIEKIGNLTGPWVALKISNERPLADWCYERKGDGHASGHIPA